MSGKVFKAKVISTKMTGTVVVAVEMPRRHKLYDKIIKKTRRFKAHDETNASVGDVVTIRETRPFSKEVTWEVLSNVESEKKENK